MLKITFFLTSFLTISFSSIKCFGQSNNELGRIKGEVIDEQNEPIIFAILKFYKNGSLIGTTKTDLKGQFRIIKLELNQPYRIEISSLGYTTNTIDSVYASDSATFKSYNLDKSKNRRINVVKYSCAAGYKICKICNHTNNFSYSREDNIGIYHGYKDWCSHFRSELYSTINKEKDKTTFIR